MPIQTIDRGTAGDTGDKFRAGVAFDICQDNDNYLNGLAVANTALVQSSIDVQTQHLTPRQFAASFFGTRSSNVVMMLGDSNAEGVGAGSIFSNGYMGLFCRAAFNAQDKGYASDRGFRYETVLNLSLPGLYNITGTGTLTDGPNGMLSVRLSLAAGQYIEVTNREISCADVYYDSSLSSGSLDFALNGVVYRNKAIVAGTDIKTTFGPAGYIINGDLYRYTVPTDVVRITAVGGTVIITGYLFIRTSSMGTLIFPSPKQAYGLDDFAVPAVVSERCNHWDSIYPNTTPRLLVICLGTNNMVTAVSKQKSPADYIIALDALIDAYETTSTSLTKSYAVWVPPRPNASMPLGTYEEYTLAIVNYCNTNGIHCIRTDLSGLGEYVPIYFADTLHYGLVGHDVLARAMCDSFDIQPQFGTTTALSGTKNTMSFAGTAPWASIAGVNSRRKSAGEDDFVTLSGLAQSNGSASLTVGAVPANCRPNVNRNFLVYADGAARGATMVAANGNIILAAGAVPVVISLDGITYPLVD